jgi:amino acid transporter
VLYAKTIFGIHFEFTRGSLVAILGIILLTAVNVRSVKLAARLQNLTATICVGMVVIIAVLGFALGRGSWSHFLVHPGAHASSFSLHGIGLALIALIFTYDGWEYVTWAAGEIENARRNLPLALIIGILLVVGTYLLVNVLFMYALTPHGSGGSGDGHALCHRRKVGFGLYRCGLFRSRFGGGAGWSTHLLLHVARWSLFPLHGPAASPLEYSGGQPAGAMCVGGGVDRQREL